MALIARLYINDQPIAIVSAQRMETGPDGVNTYKAEQWAVDKETRGWGVPHWEAEKIAAFTHEAVDGAIVCMGKAIDALKAVE